MNLNLLKISSGAGMILSMAIYTPPATRITRLTTLPRSIQQSLQNPVIVWYGQVNSMETV